MASSLSILDEDGNLFGAINVVDALVVLLVCAVAVAGVGLVVGTDNANTELGTTYVTLDLGTQPSYIVSALNEGDTYSADDESNLTITDVHLAPGDGQTRAIVRAELRGVADNTSFEYAGVQPQLGRQLRVSTSQYNTSGSIIDVGDGNTIDRDSRTVVLRDTLPASGADDVTAGDEIRLGGRTVATVEEVAVYPTGDADRHSVFVEATLNTFTRQGDQYFGNSQLRSGQTVILPGDGYRIEGEMARVGTGMDRDTTDVLIAETVSTETAEQISVGDTATVAGYDSAEVATVTTYATQNPDRERVFVGLTAETLGYGEQPQFGTTTVREGNEIRFRTDDYELSAPIERVGTLEQSGAATNRTVTLRMTDVDEVMADTLEGGMTERAGGRTTATVTDVTVEPAIIITTADNGSVNVVDHPYLRDVTLRTELRVRETTSGIRFKGDTIQQGSTVVLDLGSVTVSAEVVTIGQ